MAYSTGSGSYTALMAAVLAFALANGWSAVNADGNWPIKNNQSVGSLNWSTQTSAQSDFTTGGLAGPKTQRDVMFSIGSGSAPDTTKKSYLPNMEYTLNWFLFSDTSISNHVHGVIRFNNGVNADVYGHFSFGDIDKEGMSHSGVGYCSTQYSRGYAASTGGGRGIGSGSSDWNSLLKNSFHFAGAEGSQDQSSSQLCWLCNPTTPPFPVGSGWPVHGQVYGSGSLLWKTTRLSGSGAYLPQVGQYVGVQSLTYSVNPPINWFPWAMKAQPFSGAVSFAPIPVFPLAGNGSGARMMMVGSFPNVRTCNLDSYSPEEEVTFGGETWKLFPLLRKTDNSLLDAALTVTSGMVGFAYKKVV